MAAQHAVDQLLAKAKPILLGNHAEIDPALPSLLSVLRECRAPECYHKHSTFFDHLYGVYRILKLWDAPDSVTRCALFHSAYSNSFVNLAIFKPDVERHKVRALIGSEAEELVHLFCIVPRQQIIYDMIVSKYDDNDLIAALKDSQTGGGHIEWRRKLQEVLPPEGLMVKHIRTGEDIRVPRRLVAIFLLLTMADLTEQLFGYQDVLFDNSNGRFESAGNNWRALWPGDGKPGRWMNYVSRMGAIYTLIATEEKLYRKDGKVANLGFDDMKLIIPPVFNNCTVVVNTSDEVQARDFYWEAICMKGDGVEAEPLLSKACGHNPFVGEPHIVLGQIYLSQEKYEEAEREVTIGLTRLLELGSCWDKRVSWEAWIAWGRVMLDNAREKTWPKSSWGITNLGMVK